MVSVRPLPSLLSIANSPPCSRTIRRTINKPSPEPALFVVKYGSKTRLKLSADGVGETDDDMRRLHVRADAQDTAPFRRFEAVLDHIVKDLLHLVAIEL